MKPRIVTDIFTLYCRTLLSKSSS